jgi:hypothetical protein
MGKIKLNNLSKLSLFELLRKRKTTLSTFVKDFNLSSYEQLLERSWSLGVTPPTLCEYVNATKEFKNILDMPLNTQEPKNVVVEEQNLSTQEETLNTDFITKKKKKRETDEPKLD